MSSHIFTTYSRLWHKVCFRFRFSPSPRSFVNRWVWRLQGAQFGKQTAVPHLFLTWPHQLRVGNNCVLEGGTSFKFDGIWQPGPSIILGNRVFVGRNCEFNITQHIEIGDDCLIASGCKFIDHDHGTALQIPMNSQPASQAAIIVENDVWLGTNVVVLKGVVIRSGSIIAAGAVVTKSVGNNEIWAGIPARKIKDRV